jgi:hypothetical protein
LHQKIEAKSEHELAVFAINENVTISLWEETLLIEVEIVVGIIVPQNCWPQSKFNWINVDTYWLKSEIIIFQITFKLNV